jgi:hypothetical protein
VTDLKAAVRYYRYLQSKQSAVPGNTDRIFSFGHSGSGSSDVAPYWRIRTGIDQGDTHLGTEINLALALQACSGVKSVDFETIWGLGHTEAEDSGTASANFIAWVEGCCGN